MRFDAGGNMAAEERWVSVEDVAAHLGVTKDSIYRWVDEKKLPAHRVGRLFRFKLSEVDDWVRRGNEQTRTQKSFRSRPSQTSQNSQPKAKIRSRKSDGNG